MQVKRHLFLIPFLLNLSLSFGQSIHTEKVNTSGAEAYFRIASAFEKTGGETIPSWQPLFQTPPYQMMIAGNAIDTTALKSEMRRVFSSPSAETKAPHSTKESYHKAYKDNQVQLENYIRQLHELNVADSVKSLLYPFLPSRLQKEELFPTLFYLNYGSAEATGLGGVVISDLLHSYIIDKFKFGLLAAHEAFHSIISIAFQQRLKQDIDYNTSDFNLLYFLQTVSEEGIADLIDKPLLLQKNSPLYSEVRQLTEGHEALSTTLIKRLDSVLTIANRSEQVLVPYSDFAVLANTFGKNGGHIPGRFMGSVINSTGLLQTHIDAVEDPVSFISIYNDAVKKSGKKYPVFSKESMKYLQKLKTKYWKE